MKFSKIAFVVAGMLCFAAVACIPQQKPTVKSPPRSPKVVFEGEPVFAFKKLHTMDQARTDGALPYLIDSNGTRVRPRCFQETEKPNIWETQNPAIEKLLKAEEELIKKAVLDWGRATLLPQDTEAELSEGWNVEYKIPTIAHTELSKMRLSESQDCISPTSAKLPAGSKSITTLFGAKRFVFEVANPIPAKNVRKLKRAARQNGIKFEPILFDYKKIKGEDGKPLKNKRGRHLYEGPGGQKIIRKKIPSPKMQPAVGWTLTLKEPLYFAYGDLPPEGVWAREFTPQKCNVNLVFDDVTPRPADCDELAMVGFGVQRTDSKEEVLVKIAAEDATSFKKVALGQKEIILVAGRYLIWVESKPIVEGAQLSVDSLILAPSNGPAKPPSEFEAPPTPKKKNGKKRRKKRRGKKKA